jgi:hypothetical protein
MSINESYLTNWLFKYYPSKAPKSLGPEVDQQLMMFEQTFFEENFQKRFSRQKKYYYSDVIAS